MILPATYMTKNMTGLRTKLLSKIAGATGREQISRYIKTTIRLLSKHRLNGYLIVRFIEKCISDIESLIQFASSFQSENFHAGHSLLNEEKAKLFFPVK